MRRWNGPLWLALTLGIASAADAPLDLEELIKAGKEWLQDHVEDRFLASLEEVEAGDAQALQRLFTDLQSELQGEYLLDLAALKPAVVAVLPLLEGTEETAPYAVWLRTRMDYFEVAEQLRLVIPAPRTRERTNENLRVEVPSATEIPRRPLESAAPSVRRPTPPLAVQREVWRKVTDQRAAPLPSVQYVNRLKPVFAAFGVPEELVWVAEVESSFNRQAMSPVGAAGLFQLMPTTARSQGLALSPGDERLHPEKSARAAAAYLKQLRQRFGDWRLALAAYNAGEGRVKSLMEKYRAKTFDELSPHLPAETQFYVPKIEAIVRKREGKNLDDLRGE